MDIKDRLNAYIRGFAVSESMANKRSIGECLQLLSQVMAAIGENPTYLNRLMEYVPPKHLPMVVNHMRYHYDEALREKRVHKRAVISALERLEDTLARRRAIIEKPSAREVMEHDLAQLPQTFRKNRRQSMVSGGAPSLGRR